MKTISKPTRGGPRKGAGRPKLPTTLAVYSIRLTPEQAAAARSIGGGDLSAGIRGLIEKARG